MSDLLCAVPCFAIWLWMFMWMYGDVTRWGSGRFECGCSIPDVSKLHVHALPYIANVALFQQDEAYDGMPEKSPFAGWTEVGCSCVWV